MPIRRVSRTELFLTDKQHAFYSARSEEWPDEHKSSSQLSTPRCPTFVPASISHECVLFVHCHGRFRNRSLCLFVPSHRIALARDPWGLRSLLSLDSCRLETERTDQRLTAVPSPRFFRSICRLNVQSAFLLSSVFSAPGFHVHLCCVVAVWWRQPVLDMVDKLKREGTARTGDAHAANANRVQSSLQVKLNWNDLGLLTCQDCSSARRLKYIDLSRFLYPEATSLFHCLRSSRDYPWVVGGKNPAKRSVHVYDHKICISSFSLTGTLQQNATMSHNFTDTRNTEHVYVRRQPLFHDECWNADMCPNVSGDRPK